MNVLIIGGAGFLGSHLVERCLKEGYRIFLIDNLSSGKIENLPKEIMNQYSRYDNPTIFLYSQGDVKTFDFFGSFEDKIDVIFYLATKPGIPSVVQASIDNPRPFNEDNVGGFLNMLDYARRKNIPVVFSSSSAVYGDGTLPTTERANLNPISPYALQKLICEQYLELFNKIYGLKSVALRYFNLYGERQPDGGTYALVIGKFMKAHKAGKPFISVGDNQQRRDFVYVKDVVDANIKAAEYVLSGKDFEVFNIGSGVNYSVQEIADMVTKGKTKWGELLPARFEPKVTLADCSKAEKMLGWKAKTTLKEWFQ